MRERPYYPVTYAVRGRGTFPLDMLRYDRACPCREQDSFAIENAGSRHPRTVMLIRFSPEPGRHGADKRWQSFGWKIVPHDREVDDAL